ASIFNFLPILPIPMHFLAAGFDADDFRLEWFAEQGVDEPIDYQLTRFGIADRMAFAFEDIEQFRRWALAHELIDKLHVTVLVVFAGDDHVGAGDLCRYPLQ